MKKVTERVRRQTGARAQKIRNAPSPKRPTKRVQPVTDEERSKRFRKVQRATELRELAAEARSRHHNIDVWWNEQRKKIEEKYQ